MVAATGIGGGGLRLIYRGCLACSLLTTSFMVAGSERSALEVPVLPVRGLALFPHSIVPIAVSRVASLKALQSIDESKQLAVVAQKDGEQEAPAVSDLHQIGTLGVVLRVATLGGEEDKAVAFVHGVGRVRMGESTQNDPYLRARVEPLEETSPGDDDAQLVGLVRNVKDLFEEIVRSSSTLPNDVAHAATDMRDPAALADTIAAAAPFLSNQVRQELLATLDVPARLRLLTAQLLKEREAQAVQRRIREEVEGSISAGQREFLLREQLKAIRKELGEDDEGGPETGLLRRRLDEAGLPEEVRADAERELARLSLITPASPEHHVARTYLDWLAALPWNRSTAQTVSLQRARAILDEDHYDLDKVKERIIEYLAVASLKQDLKGPILCFVGPPGVGKTSIGRSIAAATGRKFLRLSLGGVHDEAEIRGHRRTYIGSLPGQIIRGLRQVDSNDPVFMLDEVDKLGQHVRGDPAAALLEVLDPEQNATFRDHYLDVPFDLSRVLFIATANVLDPVPAALRDRMETIQLPGYVDEEKLHIARRYLIPKQAVENGIELDHHIRFGDDAIATLINGYTHEAGVRTLERRLGAICRKRARQLVADGGDAMLTQPSTSIGAESEALEVTPEVVRKLLGPPNFLIETQLAERVRCPGVAVALAWTPHGGDILFVEVARMPRVQGEFLITGQIKDVMQESARTALSWIRSHAADYDIEPDVFAHSDIHIHVPSGAVPKDGPSAGLVMVAALLSLLVQRPGRPFVAMTGEITLSGRVLAVGGLKQKILAAKRSGVREVVLPAENRDQVLDEVSPSLRQGLTLHFVDTIRDAVELALVPRSASPSRQREPQEQTRLPMPDEWHA